MKKSTAFLILNYLVISFACFCFVSCSTIKNIPTITGAGTAAYIGHETVIDVVKDNLDIFSARDLVQLKQANKQMIGVKEQIDLLIDEKGSLKDLVMDLPKLLPLYEQARTSYIVAHTIIMSRIDEFSKHDQIILLTYETNCARLNSAITESLASNNAQTARDILQFTLLVGKFLIPLLIL